jgi:ubiquinone biosynthesis protein
MLQDRVAPFDGVRAKKQIEEAMGNLPVETWFDDFEIAAGVGLYCSGAHRASERKRQRGGD